jgi:hypothetical protein
MTYRESPPSPRLHGLVAAYWGVDSAVDGELAAQRILPDGCADLICDFACASPHMRWVGTMTCAIEVQACGRQDLFGIRFAPGGLFPLLGAPLSLLTDGSAGFAELPAQAWRPSAGWLVRGSRFCRALPSRRREFADAVAATALDGYGKTAAPVAGGTGADVVGGRARR